MGSGYGLGSFVSQIDALNGTKARLILVPGHLSTLLTTEHMKVLDFAAEITNYAHIASL